MKKLTSIFSVCMMVIVLNACTVTYRTNHPRHHPRHKKVIITGENYIPGQNDAEFMGSAATLAEKDIY